MKRYRYTLMTLALVWTASAGASHEIAITEEQMARLGINLAPVQRATWVASDRMPAHVVIPPRQEWVVSAPSGGLVTALHASLGDEVGEGEVLAQIQSPGLIALQREYLQALTEMRLASADLKRDRQLYKEGIIAERRYLQTRSRHDQATATLDERRQALALAGMADTDIEALERAKRLISTLSVRTPARGVVLEAMAVVGQRVERADPLYRLGQLEPLWLQIRVPLGRLQGVALGTPVELPCEGGEAQVSLIGHNVDPDSQTVLVRSEVRGASDCLRPGQFVQVRLKLGGTEPRYRIPSSALIRTGDQALVFVRAPFGFLVNSVRVVGHEDGYTIVAGGLKGDETVAVSGLAALKAAWMGLGGGE